MKVGNPSILIVPAVLFLNATPEQARLLAEQHGKLQRGKPSTLMPFEPFGKPCKPGEQQRTVIDRICLHLANTSKMRRGRIEHWKTIFISSQNRHDLRVLTLLSQLIFPFFDHVGYIFDSSRCHSTFRIFS